MNELDPCVKSRENHVKCCKVEGFIVLCFIARWRAWSFEGATDGQNGQNNDIRNHQWRA